MDTRRVTTHTQFGALCLIAMLAAACGGGGDSQIDSNVCPDVNCPFNGGPSIQWTNSSDWVNKTISGTSVPLTVWTLWTTTGTEKVEFLVDGLSIATSTTGSKLPGVPQLQYSGLWNTASFSDGSHVITARVTDKIGRTAETSVATTMLSNNALLTFAMTSSEEFPAVTSTATGAGQLAVNWITGLISGDVTVSGMTASAVEIRDGFAGTSGATIVTLVQDMSIPNRWLIPADSVLTLAQIARMQTGAACVNAISATYPNGEIRSQLQPNNIRVVLINLTGAQEFPPVSTFASGLAAITFDTKLSNVVVHVRTIGLDTTSIVGSYFGSSGTNGTLFAQFTRDPLLVGHWSYASSMYVNGTPLVNGGWYINVTNTANPSGEVRGQVPTLVSSP